MAHLQCSFICRPGFARSPRLLAATTALVVFFSIAAANAQELPKIVPDDQNDRRALVLIMSGMGPADQVSINYTTQVSAQQIGNDLSEISGDSGWAIRNPRTTTETVGAPGSKPSTSVLFEVAGLTNAASGILPIEPFVNALKRFRTVEIMYLQPPRMRYRGLKDFESEFVKIILIRTGNTYKFVVTVKDSGFDRLNLPKLQPSKKPAPRGMASSPRLLLVIGIAVVGFALVYLIGLRLIGRRRP